MTQAAPAQIVFGPYRLDRTNARLLRDGKPVDLTPKAFDVLHYLASRPERLVTKDELLSSVWPDVVVSDASVKVCIREIRQALEDDARSPTYIDTVHRRGYRFIARVVADEAAAPQAAPHPIAESRHAIVGRDGELWRLSEYLRRTAQGLRQCVFVTGGPGTGKTALVDTFLQSVQASLERGALILAGHCFEQFGISEPYMPMWEAIGHLSRDRRSAAMEGLLARHAAAYVPVSQAHGGGAPSAAATEPRAMSERLLREMADAIESLTATTSVILFLEDLHWADYSTLDLISALARRRSPARLMILATYRPAEVIAGGHPLGGLAQGLSTAGLCREISVEFLDRFGVAQLLALRFGNHKLPGLFVERLHQRTEGHPLFVVQLLNDLVEQGVVIQRDGTWQLAGETDGEGGAWLAVLETQIPRTVRAMIDDHLGRLEREEQQALEAAAVGGVEFSAAAVAAALDKDVVNTEEMCDELVRRHRFLEQRGVSEWPDGTVATCYRFVHELYHGVVYEKIPAGRRARLHQMLGLRLEKAWGDRAAEEAAALAMHFELARDWARAVKYLRQAAQVAGRQFAHREAAHYLRRALAAVDKLAEQERSTDELEVLMALGVNMQVTQGFAAPEVEEIHRRAYALCRRGGGDLRETFSVLWGIWLFHKVRSDLRKAEEMAGQLLALARESGDAGYMLQAHQAMCVTALCSGRPEVTRDHMEQAQAIYDRKRHAGNTESFGQDPGVATLAFGGVALWLLDREEEAVRTCQRAVDLARELNQPSSAALAAHFAAMVDQLRGNAPAVERWADANVKLSEGEGFSFWLAGGWVLRGWARALMAKHRKQGESAVDEMRRGVEAWLATGSRTYHTYHLGLLAEALLRVGRGDDAMQALEEGLQAAQSLPEGLYEAELHRLRGRVLVHTSRGRRRGEADACISRAVAIAQQQGAKRLERAAMEELRSFDGK